MSDVWVSTVYFELQAECDYQQVSHVFRQLAESGLTFDRASAQWISPDGMDIEKVPDLETALSLTVQHRGGAINLYDAETVMNILVSFHPCGGGVLSSKDVADRAYGHATLFIEYAYLRGLNTDPSGVIQRRYELIFRWSNVLARATNAFYGWGDLESVIWDTGYIALTSELRQGVIPRFGWWNYFSKEYIARIGKNRIFSTGIWLTEETESGWIVILRPPGVPTYATRSERIHLGLQNLVL